MPPSVERSLYAQNFIHIDMFQASEGLMDDRAPEIAFFERRTAAAQLVLPQAFRPDVADLADREKTVDLSQEPIKKRTAGSAGPPDVKNLDSVLAHGLSPGGIFSAR